MAQYYFSYSDFDNDTSFIQSSSRHMKNYATNRPLSTTRSESDTAGYMATYTLSDILQGRALYRPKDFVLQSQQDSLTSNFAAFLNRAEEPILSESQKLISPGVASGSDVQQFSGESVDLERSASMTFAPIHPTEVDTYAGVGSDSPTDFAPSEFIIAGYENGRLPDAALKTLAGGNGRLWHVAAAAFDAMREEMIAVGFTDPFAISSYRSYDDQFRIKYDENSNRVIDNEEGPGGWENPGAATPGFSKHGWGIAIDWASGFRKDQRDNEGLSGLRWLERNAYRYGFVHPLWARPGGSLPEEWHWEYRAHLIDRVGG